MLQQPRVHPKQTLHRQHGLITETRACHHKQNLNFLISKNYHASSHCENFRRIVRILLFPTNVFRHAVLCLCHFYGNNQHPRGFSWIGVYYSNKYAALSICAICLRKHCQLHHWGQHILRECVLHAIREVYDDGHLLGGSCFHCAHRLGLLVLPPQQKLNLQFLGEDFSAVPLTQGARLTAATELNSRLVAAICSPREAS